MQRPPRAALHRHPARLPCAQSWGPSPCHFWGCCVCQRPLPNVGPGHCDHAAKQGPQTLLAQGAASAKRTVNTLGCGGTQSLKRECRALCWWQAEEQSARLLPGCQGAPCLPVPCSAAPMAPPGRMQQGMAAGRSTRHRSSPLFRAAAPSSSSCPPPHPLLPAPKPSLSCRDVSKSPARIREKDCPSAGETSHRVSRHPGYPQPPSSPSSPKAQP